MSEDAEHELILPPISDTDNICLPLSVNAVAKYWNIDLPMTEANEIASKYLGMNGSILIEGINLAERHGLSSLVLHSSISELKQAIDMGIPPLSSYLDYMIWYNTHQLFRVMMTKRKQFFIMFLNKNHLKKEFR